MTAEELLQELVAAGAVLGDDLKGSLWRFIVCYSKGEWSEAEGQNLYPLVHLLAEKLVSQFRGTFLTHRPASLSSFLSQEVNTCLILALAAISQHVPVVLPEMANLLMVVLKKLVVITGEGAKQLDWSVCKTPLFVGEMKAWLHNSRTQSLDPVTTPFVDPPLATPSQRGTTLLNYSSSPTWLDRLLCTLVTQGSTAGLTTWDYSLILLLAYEVLGLRPDPNGLSDQKEVEQQLEEVSGLIEDIMVAWVGCYSTLERDSCESLRVLVPASSDEEPSGTESDRERKIQQFKEGVDYAILQTAHHLYYFLRCVLYSWRQLAAAWAGSADELTSQDALCALLKSAVSLDGRYSSVLSQVHFVGVFLEVWATWSSLMLHTVETRSHSATLCLEMATQSMQFEARHTISTAVTYVVDSQQELVFWLPESLQDYIFLISVVLEKMAALLRHSSTHATQRSSSKKAISPMQRRKQVSEVEQLMQDVGVMASAVLDLCRSEPKVQLGILYLLSVAVPEPVAVVESFLPLLSTGHLHSELSLLERHLAVVEGALSHLQPSAVKGPGWWEVLRHLSSLMKQCGDNLPVVQLLLHFHQTLLKRLPHPTKGHLWEQSVLDFLLHTLSKEAGRMAKEGCSDGKAAPLVAALLHTVEVGLADEQCLHSFASRPQCYLLLASLLPAPEHAEEVLSIYKVLLCPPHATHSSTVAKAQDHCVGLLVRVALSTNAQRMAQFCHSLAASPNPSVLLRPLDIGEMDQLQVSFRQIYNCDADSKVLVSTDLLCYLSLLSLVWCLLEEVAGSVRTQLLANNLKDARDSFGPALAGLVHRLTGVDEGQVTLAKERVTEVVCHLLRVYMNLVRVQPETSSKALSMFVEDLHPWMQGVMHLTAGQRYCQLLFEVSLFSAEGPSLQTAPEQLQTKWKGPSYEEYLTTSSSTHKRKGDGVKMGDPGYDGDVETVHSSDESPLPGMSLLTPPPAAQCPLVSVAPVIHCAHSVVEACTQQLSTNSLRNCEAFLLNLCALLQSSDNVEVLADKGLLALLLDGLGVLFSCDSLASLRCCFLLEKVIDLFAMYQVEPLHLKQIFHIFQKSKYHLERLPSLLLSMSAPQHGSNEVYPWKPSAYITFTFHTVTISVDSAVKIPMNSSFLLGEKDSFFLSMWFSATKHTYPVNVHLVSIPIDRAFLEIWAGSCTGDIIIRLSPELKWSYPDEESEGSIRYGTIVNHGSWNHLFVVFTRKHQTEKRGTYEIQLTIDGQTFDPRILNFEVPSWLAISGSDCTMLLGGGADAGKVWTTILQEHKEDISWSLASLQLMPGRSTPQVAQSLYTSGPDHAAGSLDHFSAPPQEGVSPTDVFFTTRDKPFEPLVPYMSYSAHTPHEAHVMCINKPAGLYMRPTLDCTCEKVSLPVHISPTHCPHMLDVLHATVGMDGLIYLFAKVVEEDLAGAYQAAVLRLIQRATASNPGLAREFAALKGTLMLAYCMRSGRTPASQDVAEAVLDWCFGGGRMKVVETSVLADIVADWRIWHKNESVWVGVLNVLESLLANNSECFDHNWSAFMQADVLGKLLVTEKERDQESLQPMPALVLASFIRLLTCLIGSPPKEVCLKRVWQHVLVPKVNLLQLITRDRHDSTFSILDTHEFSDTSPENLSPDCLSPSRGADQSDMVLPVEEGEEEEEEEEEDHFLLFLRPQITNPLTFEQITGLAKMTVDEEDTESVAEGDDVGGLEVGLLGEIRRQLLNLPDSSVSNVMGPIVTYESLLAIANHTSILVRTAAVTLLDEYFKRVGEGVKTNFVQLRGFDLLANQLRGHSVSAELYNALFSIALGGTVTLSATRPPLPTELTSYQMASLVPVLACLTRTTQRPSLCQSALSLLHQMYTDVKKMPVFFAETQGMQTLVQLVVSASTAKLNKEDLNMLIGEIFHFMCTIANHSLRSTEEALGSLRVLLAYLAHYEQQIKEVAKGSSPMVVKVLHVLQLLLQQNSLQQTTFDAVSVATKPSRLSPLLGTMRLTPPTTGGEGHTADLSSRVCEIVGISVKMIVFQQQPFSERDTQKFNEPVDLATGLQGLLKSRVAVDHIDLAFTRFLLRYLHLGLYGILQRTSGSQLLKGEVGEFPHFAVSSRLALCEQYSALLSYLLSTSHSSSLHIAVLRFVWRLEGRKEVLACLLCHGNRRKALSCRITRCVVSLMSATSDDPSLASVLSELFDCVVQQKDSSVVKGGVKLGRFVGGAEDSDPKVQAKYTATMEEVKAVDQKALQDHDTHRKEWRESQERLLSRCATQTESRHRVIETSYEQFTKLTLDHQNKARRAIMEGMLGAVTREKMVLKLWRRVVMLNTTQRGVWSREESRDMWLQLDPTEGPNRERRRMIHVPKNIPSKYLLQQEVGTGETEPLPPLAFLFENVHDYPGYATEGPHSSGESPSTDVLPICTMDCSAIWPDKCCRGSFVLSQERFSFFGIEPIGDPNMTRFLPSDDDTVFQHWSYEEVVEVHRRRYELQDKALEFFLSNGKTVFLSFNNNKFRNTVYSEIVKLSLPNLMDNGEGDNSKLKNIVGSWIQGEMTNFEYLMELNKLAGRTFNDLMQYPIFPFILADYTSSSLNLADPKTFRKFNRPIAIQDESNIERYQKHYDEVFQMFSDVAPHHYSSHYSNSSTVLHYMVRVPPFTLMFLDFQGQNFDIPDRTFHCISTAWELSSSKSLSDVKELIPEFFDFPDFLVNAQRLDFGVRQTGERVDSVILPPWAQDSPRIFILKHRQALESRFVSEHLHEWIDLIFGYQQRDKEAIAAINVFHPSTYSGSAGVDAASMDPTLYARLRSEVKMYGQMPIQLFKDPHPARHHTTALREFMWRVGSLLRRMQDQSPFSNLGNPHVARVLMVWRLKLSQNGQDFIGSQGGVEPVCVHTEETHYHHARMYYLGSGEERLAICCPKSAFIPAAAHTSQSMVVVWGSWDGAVHVLPFSGGVTKLHTPALDQVRFVDGACNGQLIITAGILGVVSCWRLENTAQSVSYTGEVVHLRGHNGPVTSLCVCRPFGIVVSGSEDRTAIIWDTNRLSFVASLEGHEGDVTAIATSPTMGDVVTACPNSKGQLGSVVRLWSVNGSLVARTEVHSRVTLLSYTSAPEGVFVNVVIGGLANGNIRLWSSWDLTVVREIRSPFDKQISVVSLAVGSSSKELYAGYKDDTMAVWIKPDSS